MVPHNLIAPLSPAVPPPPSLRKLARLFEAAHLCSTAAWASDTGSPRFRSEKLAESVLNHLNPQRAGGADTASVAGAAVAEGVSSSELKAWVAERAPLLHHCLSTFMNTRCFLYGDAKEEGIAGWCYPAFTSHEIFIE